MHGVFCRFVWCDTVDSPLPAEETMLAEPLWLVSNVPVTKEGCAMDQGDSVLSYTPPHPQKGTGFHRYAWLALEQSEKVDKQVIASGLAEQRWDARGWLKATLDEQTGWKLCGLTFHRAAWTEGVSRLYQDGRIQKPDRVVRANQHVPATYNGNVHVQETTVAAPIESTTTRTVVQREPIYGKVVERDWMTVTRALNKYAFA